eukprot:m.14726 g.14726  ORF g.14726 m.14726 type:complete len:266 (+) comp10261_c0_seq2:349-1146(+)
MATLVKRKADTMSKAARAALTSHRQHPNRPRMPTAYVGCCGSTFPSTRAEEMLSILTHGMAIPMVILQVMNLVNMSRSEVQTQVAYIYGASLIGQFVVSTGYHVVCWKFRNDMSNNYVRIGQLCDRSMIFLYIASSYTPFLLILDLKKEHVGYFGFLFWAVWLQAIFGTIYTLFFVGTLPRLELWMYILMGGSGLGLAMPMYENATEYMLPLLCAGLATYFAGTYFFAHEGHIPYAHGIWHMFVTGGSLFIYFAIVCMYHNDLEP